MLVALDFNALFGSFATLSFYSSQFFFSNTSFFVRYRISLSLAFCIYIVLCFSFFSCLMLLILEFSSCPMLLMLEFFSKPCFFSLNLALKRIKINFHLFIRNLSTIPSLFRFGSSIDSGFSIPKYTHWQS